MDKAKEILRTAISAAAALACFFLLYKMFAFLPIAAGVLAVALYFGVYFLLKPTSKIGKVEVDTMQNGEDSLELMREARKDIESMDKILPRIKKPSVQKDVSGLIGTGDKILSYLTEHPGKIMEAHRFADYYLDMAQKLVSRYVDLQKMDSESVREVMRRTENALGTLNVAFDRQLGRLVEGDLMEIDTDIRVLEETMKMEDDI